MKKDTTSIDGYAKYLLILFIISVGAVFLNQYLSNRNYEEVSYSCPTDTEVK